MHCSEGVHLNVAMAPVVIATTGHSGIQP